MANPDDILRQYGPDALPYPDEQPGYAPPAPPSNDGFLFSLKDGELKFNPWESVKSFMSYRAPPGALSTSGDDQPIRDAFDTAGWVGLSGLGMNYAGALPANSVGVFGGRLGAANLAKQGIHAPEKAIQMAERMKAEGATPAEIWQATARFMEKEDPRFSAVHFGKEGAPQFEIPDYQAKWPTRMQDEWEMRNFMESRPGETLDHPLLYAAYPEMRNVPMTATARPRFPNEGAFDPGTFPGDIRDARFSVSGPTPEKARSAAIHELDHGTAFIEGHARGSSPERAAYVVDPNDHEIRNILAERDYLTRQFEKSVPGEDPHYRSRKADLEYANQALDARAKELGYKRSAGETRARTAQESANMTPEQLRASPPWERQDVPYEQQILEMYGTGPQRKVEEFEPIRAYHGTSNPDVQFEPYSDHEIGPHFGSANQANSRLDFRNNGADGTSILPVDLHLRNPLEIADPGAFDALNLPFALERTGQFSPQDIKRLKRHENRIYQINDDNWADTSLVRDFHKDLQDILVARGYDSIKYRNTAEHPKINDLMDEIAELPFSGSEQQRSNLYAEKAALEKELAKSGEYSYVPIKRGTVKSATTGKTLFSSGAPVATTADILKQYGDDNAGSNLHPLNAISGLG